MLTFFFTDKNGKRCEIKNVLTAEISADVDVPADELVMTVPYDEKFGNADILEVYDGRSLVFVGQVDEIVSIVRTDGAIVRLSGRSLAGRLLDNEAEPVTYVNPAAKFIFERHLKPFGIVGYDGDEHPFMGTIKIEKGMTNSVNRQVNCDTANVKKTVEASRMQIAAITELDAAVGLDSLPEKLAETARLRIKNPEMSIAELAALHTPPVTKSCLNHRLRKLLEMAEKTRI